MRKILFIGVLLSANLLFAQDKFIVEYKLTSETDPEKEKEFQREMAQKGIGSFNSSMPTLYYQLDYNEGESYYNKIETINNNQGSGSSASFTINIGGEHKVLVNNLTSKTFKQEINLDGKDYNVVYPYEDYQWKITDIEETILGYRTIKAVGTTDKGKQIAAWYAPDIKIEVGPRKVNGLPGLVLKTVIDLGTKMGLIQTIEAEKITLNPKKMPKLKPLKGEEINQEQFKVLQEKSKEKMMKSFSMGVDTKID